MFEFPSDGGDGHLFDALLEKPARSVTDRMLRRGMLQLAARAALIMFLVWAVSLIFEPKHHAARLEIASDTLEHGLIALGIVMLASAALPRTHLWLISLTVLGLGASLELLQLAQLVPGRFEVRDIMANLTGVILGMLAVGIGEVRSDEGNAAHRRGDTKLRALDE
ncbi:MAG: VanZ family protein [Phenylobacterium sp.]|nr:VanZ family protein [Phenylobacterium sp.]